MITHIDIKNFGRFLGFDWNNTFNLQREKPVYFSKVNIIYGRNYSGKTTLSRIVRCLENKTIPKNYTDVDFLAHGDFESIHSSSLGSQDLGVRVYNSDFVNENLNFLINQDDGEIKTFAIVGSENIEITKEITEIQNALDGSGAAEGPRSKYIKLADANKQSLDKRNTKQNQINALLRDFANNEIKRNSELNFVTYNIEQIKADIEEIKRSKIVKLSDDEVNSKRNLLREQELIAISAVPIFAPKISQLEELTLAIIGKKITPSNALQELLNDSLLQIWVKDGMSLHKEKRETCAFCRQNLPHDIWEVLGSHFNQESLELENEIRACLASIENEKIAINNLSIPEKGQFYSDEKVQFEDLYSKFTAAKQEYLTNLSALHELLIKRKNSIFESLDNSSFEFESQKITSCIDELNRLIASNNSKTATLTKDKTKSKYALRIDYVLKFTEAINLEQLQSDLSALERSCIESTNILNTANKVIQEKEETIKQLRIRQKDERKGAQKVNELLNHYFGHNEISMQAIDDEENLGVKFEIVRSGKKAYNLSEGERSLVAFCYFMAKLEDPETKDKHPIIYIDDPISSLDANHIYFIFSLIDNYIIKPLNFEQLFISTHNLEFLKYIRKLSLPKKIKSNHLKQFLIERKDSTSTISLMPAYLERYATEFVYLFHQIYKCKDAGWLANQEDAIYSFGNNLRKFLETYLFYKYPENTNLNERVMKFLNKDATSSILTTRYANEYSHLEEIFDRGMSPIDLSEIPKIAKYILECIYANDHEQYNSLMNAIDEPQRVR